MQTLSGFSPPQAFSELDALFLKACERGMGALALLDRGASIHARLPEIESSCLHLAASCDQPALLEALLDRGADIEALDHLGVTPLGMASFFPRRSCLDILLRRGADPRHQHFPLTLNSPYKGHRHPTTAPLHLAAVSGNLAAAEALILAGAATETADFDGSTALHMAAQIGHPRMMRLLLRLGAKPRHRDFMGRDAFLISAMWGNPEGMDIMLKAGADALAVDANGDGAIELSAGRDGDLYGSPAHELAVISFLPAKERAEAAERHRARWYDPPAAAPKSPKPRAPKASKTKTAKD